MEIGKMAHQTGSRATLFIANRACSVTLLRIASYRPVCDGEMPSTKRLSPPRAAYYVAFTASTEWGGFAGELGRGI